MTLEELALEVQKLRGLYLGLREELGEQGDGKKVKPLHERVENLEKFCKRQTT